MNNIINVNNISYEYITEESTFKAIDNLSLNVKPGEFVAIIGHNGSGKSTFLHVAGILDMPSSGIIKINGKEAKKLSVKEQARLRRNEIGFIFQRFNLMSQLTVLENIMLPMIKEDTKKAIDLLNRMGLGSKSNKYPGQLSGGEQQRVAIARALINDPSIILADEPTGELDTKNADAIMQVLKDLNQNDGVSIVVVTHNQASADFADEILHMSDGNFVNNESK